MKLQEYRETFYSFSGKASDISRQLAFAAIAIIWLFKKDTPAGQITVPPDLVLPGILTVAALTADLLQYSLGSLIWHHHYRSLEKRSVPETADTQHSPWLERPITGLFVIKVILVILAYCLIFVFLLRAFRLTL